MTKQRRILKNLALTMGLSMAFFVGCGGNGGDGGHTHVFDQEKQEENYLKNEQTCAEAKQYYYSCVCGEKGEEAFSVGIKGLHDYSAEVVGEEYLLTPANCQAKAVYYKSCSDCGRATTSQKLTFSAGELGDHDYSQEVADGKYLASEATKETAAVYYKSCICGAVGTETFASGKPLKDLTAEEKEAYKPVSLTMTLYDPANSVYGFTYNTQEKPLRPVIQIEEGNTLTENAQEADGAVTKWSSYDKDENEEDVVIYYYVVKAEVTLKPSTTYTYRVYDRYADVGSEAITFTTRDTAATSFTFSHMSDTQSAPSSGSNFGQVLAQIKDTSDFVLHTGDVVEYSRYEYEWTDMLHANFEYLSKMPVMALAGNHDTVYKSGTKSSELWKHFNNKIPAQSAALGYYYSFIYGNAKFIMLNTNNNNTGDLEQAQYDWLINELENNDSDWTIVAMHAPLYSIGQWGADPTKNQQSLALRKQLKGIFAEYGVDIVFQGHDHLLSRTNPIAADGTPTTETWETVGGVEYSVDPDGVIYVMNGTVGTNAKSVVDVEEGIYKYAQASASRTWADIVIDGNTLTLEAKYHNGMSANVYHKWGIKKTENAA